MGNFSVNVDRRDYRVPPANVHDSRCLGDLLDEIAPDKGVWADCAYSGEALEAEVRGKGLIPHICEKGYRGRRLTILLNLLQVAQQVTQLSCHFLN